MIGHGCQQNITDEATAAAFSPRPSKERTSRFVARLFLAGWLGTTSDLSMAEPITSASPSKSIPIPVASSSLLSSEEHVESTPPRGFFERPAYDAIRWIVPAADRFGSCVYPTLIHRDAMVTVAVPIDLVWETNGANNAGYFRRNDAWQCARIRAVALRKISGAGAGQVFIAKAIHSQAQFRSLTAGAYDVYYLTGNDASLDFGDGVVTVNDYPLPETADRRILVELSFVALVPTPMTPEEKDRLRFPSQNYKRVEEDTGSAAQRPLECLPLFARSTAVPMPEFHSTANDGSRESEGNDAGLGRQHEDRGWDLLAKQSLYTALREFQLAVHDAADVSRGRERGDANLRRSTVAGCTWREVLDANESLIESLRRGTVGHAALARDLAGYVHRRPDAAEMILGLARTFDAISRESRPLIRGAEQMAVVCYLTACRLDARFLEPFNDLGVLYYQHGYRKEAETLLRRVGERSIHPAFAYNLGCVLWDVGAVEQAMSLWNTALELDSGYIPALFTMTRSQLQSNSLALYPEDCRRLAERLGRIVQEEPAGTRLHAETRRLLAHFEVLGRELAWNEGGFHQATIIPTAPHEWIPLSQPAGYLQPSCTEETLSEAQVIPDSTVESKELMDLQEDSNDSDEENAAAMEPPTATTDKPADTVVPEAPPTEPENVPPFMEMDDEE